jgi:hypothetical protein
VFVSEELKSHLETSATIQTKSLILAEWNMNMPDNIYKLGNYRYRPSGAEAQFLTLPLDFDQLDSGNYYTGATDADVVIDGGFTNANVPQLFTSIKDKLKTIYSLEDCLKPFRPRSGINKPLFIGGKYLANSGAQLAQRLKMVLSMAYQTLFLMVFTILMMQFHLLCIRTRCQPIGLL